MFRIVDERQKCVSDNIIGGVEFDIGSGMERFLVLRHCTSEIVLCGTPKHASHIGHSDTFRVSVPPWFLLSMIWRTRDTRCSNSDDRNAFHCTVVGHQKITTTISTNLRNHGYTSNNTFLKKFCFTTLFVDYVLESNFFVFFSTR